MSELIKFTYAASPQTEGRRVMGLASPVYSGKPGTEFAASSSSVHRFAAGAFDDSLAKFPDVKLLFNHDMAKVMSRPPAVRFWADSSGLHFDGELNKTSWSNDALALMEANQLAGVSVGIYPIEEEKSKEGNVSVRTFTKVALEEVSLVYDPAFTATTLAQYSEENLSHYRNLLQEIFKSL